MKRLEEQLHNDLSACMCWRPCKQASTYSDVLLAYVDNFLFLAVLTPVLLLMFIATFVTHQRKEHETLYLYSHCNCRTVSNYLSTSLSEAKKKKTTKNKWVYPVHRWPLHLEHVCRNGPPSHWKYRRPGLIRFHGTTSCPSRLDPLLCQMGVLIYTISTIWKAIRNAVLQHKWHPESLTFWGEHTGEVGKMCCAIWQTTCLNNYTLTSQRNANLCNQTSTDPL